MTEELVRKATAADAARIAEVHVSGWRWGYRGLIDERILAGLDVDRRRATWDKAIENPAMWVWVAERAGSVVGFVAAGTARNHQGDGAPAEIYALYQLEEVAGSGVGHALLEQAVAEARTRGFVEALLWVLETNERAVRFYTRQGWHDDGGRKRETMHDVELSEVRMRRPL